jgi:hypothetical protein
MRARGGIPRQVPVARAVYSIAELASIGNVSRQSLGRLLDACGIEFVYAGRTALVPLSEIRRKIPPLWESILAAEKVLQMTQRRAGDKRSAGPSRPSRPRSP